MAGIGFTLRRMLGEDGIVGPLKAFGYAAAISSGPWLISSLALAFLGAWGALAPDSQESRTFLAILSYGYAFSLVGVGGCQLIASRFLADRLYAGRGDDIAGGFVQLLVLLLLIQLLVATLFASQVPLDPLVKLFGVMFYLALNGTWLAMLFLSAAQDYRAITVIFGLGCVVSLALGILGGRAAGLTGQLAGFGAGYMLAFLALLGRMDREFGWPRTPPPDLLSHFGRFWTLAVTGLAYNLGIWVDKMLFWFHPDTGQSVAGPLRMASVYDNPMFLAYLTVLPALALFLLKVETDFYDAYRGYFASVSGKESYEELLVAKSRIVSSLRDNLGLLLKIQGFITLTVVVFTPELVQTLHLAWFSTFVFLTGAVGAFFHVAHLIVLILLLYFDCRSEALWLSLIFLVTNTAFTLLAFAGGLPAYGYGYAFSCVVTFFCGLLILNRAMRDLEFKVFMQQPLA